MKKETITTFCREYDYPQEVCDALLDACQVICTNEKAAALLEQNQQMLWREQFTAVGDDLALLDQAAELTDIHPYTVHLLFYVLCAEQTKQLYLERGISPEIYRTSMLALKWKMQKTYKMYGVRGSAWAAWFRPFFLLHRFGIGRLEFELSPALADYQTRDHAVKKGDTVVNVHIPAAGPLTHDAVVSSYQQAARFFEAHFPNGVVPFQCGSWLLYPPVLDMVPQGNLWAFSRDYDIIAVEKYPSEDDRWRVFLVPETVPVEDYPEETTLQRKLKAWLLEGHTMGIGVGMFFLTRNTDA